VAFCGCHPVGSSGAAACGGRCRPAVYLGCGSSGPAPTFAVYLLGKSPPTVAWEARWVRWPDFWLPGDQAHARRVLHEAWERALTERVEIACPGGRGRTGTALACLAIIDGLPPEQAVAFVRQHYDPHAVETPWQKRYAAHFPIPQRSG
jgi:hypothetical protein